MEISDTPTSSERRVYKRYNASDGAFAAISPNSFKLGQILNISRGGLAFQYIETKKNSAYTAVKEKNLFLSSKRYYVQGIPFKTVADNYIPNDNPLSTIKMRRCSIEFGEMSFDQIINLDNYIINNTDQYCHF